MKYLMYEKEKCKCGKIRDEYFPIGKFTKGIFRIEIKLFQFFAIHHRSLCSLISQDTKSNYFIGSAIVQAVIRNEFTFFMNVDQEM